MPRDFDFSQDPAYRKFKAKLKIDKDNLDGCVLEQPDLYADIGEEASFATSRRDQIKMELEEATAELTKQFRLKLEKADGKVTEKQITAEVESSERVKKLKRAMIEANNEVALWSVLKGTVDTRGSMLKVAAQLFASGYFTRVSVSGARNALDEGEANNARRAGGLARREYAGKRQ